MCIKSEKRFDFLKELVSTVPDLQGDHDEPLALYQNMTGETQETNTTKRDTSNTSQRPKLPRQLSTPKPRYVYISGIDWKSLIQSLAINKIFYFR